LGARFCRGALGSACLAASCGVFAVAVFCFSALLFDPLAQAPWDSGCAMGAGVSPPKAVVGQFLLIVCQSFT